MPHPTDASTTLDDLSLHYLDWGTVGHPPLVCLHGITQTAHSWDEVAPSFARTHHVRALDQRGHGDSSWAADGDYRLATQSRDVERFVETTLGAPAVVVALSMGGLVALTLTARRPDLVRALVVVDIAPEVRRDGVDNIRNFVAATDELDTFEDFVARAHAFNPRRSLDNIRERLRHNLRRLPNGRWTWKYDPALRNPARVGEGMGDLWERVSGIRCPVLIVRGGESDILDPEVAARFGGVVGAEVRTVPGAGHSVMGDNPSGFLAAVEPFLADLPRG
ncbi:MAG: alpha/beta hydrolase [Deltaproteobacteria bacterium]|nr:alpha/beta hydrolase [Deltaproteobacteria bacterium]